MGTKNHPKYSTWCWKRFSRTLYWMRRKGYIIDGEMLLDLCFADDVALSPLLLYDLEVQINEVNSKNKDNDLKMHKERFMTNFNTDDSILVTDQGIARVNEYKYCTKQ